MNNYQLNDEIGKGVYSIVYKGRKRRTTDYYAISSIEKERRAQVLNSVQTLRSLRHPNVIEFHNWYETNNHLWVITELCIGGDLRSILAVEKKLNGVAVQAFGRDVASGLMFIHSKGVLCNDLKPSNLLMDAAASIRYYDFSIACPFTSASERPVVGTALYMAPELFLFGRGVTSMASDMWSFGCLLYEMATGSPPFPGKRLEEVVRAIMTATAPAVRGMPDSFNALVASLLTKDPLHRATWADVAASPFWENNLPLLSEGFPAEAAFSAYRSRRGKEWATPSEIDIAIKQAVEAARSNTSSANRGGDEGDLDDPPVDKEVNFTPSADLLSLSSPVRAAASADLSPGTRRMNGKNVDASDAQSLSSLPEGRTRPTPARRNSTTGTTAPSTDMSRLESAGPNRRSAGRSKNAKPAAQYRSRSTGRRGSDANSSNTERSSVAAAAAAGDDRYTRAQLEAFNKGSLKSVGLENLLWSNLDAHIRPLCMNNRIERYVQPSYDARALGFQAVTLEELKTWSSEDLTKFATTAYRNMSSTSATFDQKLNILNYFETICVDASTANILVNSSMMTLCLKMAGMKQASATFRATAASIMGLLVRHTTFIHSDLSKSGIVGDVALLLVSETSTRVKRRLIACLGEFLFFIAVQAESDRKAWVFSASDIQQAFLATLAGGDDILKHYAAKTIENLASVRDRYMARALFCTPRFVELLLSIGVARVTPTCTENMRTAAICAALKLGMAKESLIPVILRSDCFPISSYVSVLQTSPLPYTAQILLTFLNFTLVKSLVTVGNDYTTMWNNAVDKKSLYAHIFATSELSTSEADAALGDLSDMSDEILLGLAESSEHCTTPTNGKILLFIVLINCLKASPLPRLCTPHILGFVDRLLRSTDGYVAECGNVLCAALSQFVSEKLAATAKRVSTATPILLEALLQLLSASTIRSRLDLQPDVFANLGDCVEKCLSSTLYGAYEDSFNGLCECMVMDPELTARYAPLMCTHLVGSYLQMVTRRQSHRRFTAVRILGGFVAALTADKKSNNTRRDATLVNDTVDSIAETLTPILPNLLTESPPVPSRTLSLLALCGRARPTSLADVATAKTVDLLLGFLSNCPERDTQNAIELLLLCMQQSGNTREDLVAYAISKKLPSSLGTIVSAAVSEQQDDLAESACSLTAFVLRKVGNDPSSRAATQCLCLVENEKVSRAFLPISAKGGISAESASSAVNDLCQLSSVAQADLISATGLPAFMNALRANREATTSPECAHAALEYLLKALRYTCENCRKGDLLKLGQDADLTGTVKSLSFVSSLPRGVTAEASRVLRLLKS